MVNDLMPIHGHNFSNINSVFCTKWFGARFSSRLCRVATRSDTCRERILAGRQRKSLLMQKWSMDIPTREENQNSITRAVAKHLSHAKLATAFSATAFSLRIFLHATCRKKVFQNWQSSHLQSLKGHLRSMVCYLAKKGALRR